MKQKLLMYTKLMLIGLLLFLASCEKDPVLEEKEHGHELGKNPNEVSMDFFKEITQIEDVNLFLKERMEVASASALGRMSSYKFSDFTIGTEVIYQCLLRDGELAFSFKLYPKNGIAERGEMFNLVITRIEGQWESSIFLLVEKVNPNPDEYFSEIVEVYNSVGLTSLFARRVVELKTRLMRHCPKLLPCTSSYCDGCLERCVSVEVIGYILHTPEMNETPTFKDPIFLYNDGGGGSNTHSVARTTPGEELLKMSNNVANKSALTDLKGQTNQAAEKGYAIKKNSANNTFRSPITANATDPNYPNHIRAASYLGGEYVGLFHTHPKASDGYIPMFPPEDINYLYFVALSHQTNGQPKNYSEYFLTLTVPQGTYAIKIKDIVKFAALRNSKWEGKDGLDQRLKGKFDVRDTEGDIDLMIKDLLDVIKELDAGIGLYVASEDLSTWSEIVHELNPMSPNFGKPKTIPCN